MGKGVSEWVLKARVAHHAALLRLAQSLGSDATNGLELWRKLHRVESQTSYKSVKRCNGELSEEEWEAWTNRVEGKVAKILGGVPPGFFVNGDPRGYALKLREKSVPMPLHTDWGGYQILAPDIGD